MRALRRFLMRLARSVTSRRDEDRLREELEAHLALQTEENVRAGMSPVEARRQARLNFGAVEAVKEDYRDEQGLPALNRLGQDLRYTVRQLRRAPSFTLAVTLTLALGIGATTAIFSLFHQMLLRALPVADPDRLVNLSAPGPKGGQHIGGLAGDTSATFSYPMFRDLERVQRVFTGIAALGANLSSRGETLSGSALAVSGSYFPVLGVHPALGRLIAPGDDYAPGESNVVVLSYAYWQRAFGGHPDVLNATLIVNGRTMTIVGVAPRGFDGTTLGAKPQVYVPITMRGYLYPGWEDWEGFENRRSYWTFLFARLAPGVSLDQARTTINAVYHGIINDVEAPLQKGMSDKAMAEFKAKTIGAEPGWRGQSSLHGEVQPPLTLLLSVTALVLVIACANIANLLLARTATRAHEMATRLSIGASRGRLIVQLLTESCLLALLGGLAGLAVAKGTLIAIQSLLPEGLAASVPTTLDGTMLLFATAVTFATGILFGLFPALHSTRPDLLSTLKGAGGQSSSARGAARFRAGLATTQIALSMTLLVAAGLFIKSLMNVTRVDLGMTIDHLVTFTVSPGLNGYTPERSRLLFERLEDDLTAQPGVTSVTASQVPAITGIDWLTGVRVQGFQAGPDTDASSYYNNIAPSYFRTMGIPLISGREFTRADRLDTPKVAIVNEAFAKKFGLGRDAVGKRMSSLDHDEELDAEIVGLVQNAKYDAVKNEMPPVFFRPYRQREELGSLTFYVRTSLHPGRIIGVLPKVVAALDPDLPVDSLTTLEHQVRENVFLDRLITLLSTGFAMLATLLAAVALYGVLAYTVAQRTREIGLRMALGAAPGRVRGMVLRQVGVMAAIGGVIGLAGAVALGRAAEALLFEMQGHDPMVFTAAAVALILVALCAGWIPAHRASRVDPMRALRYE